MKFQNSNFHGSKVTKRTRDTYIQTYIHTLVLHTNNPHVKSSMPLQLIQSSKCGKARRLLLGVIHERIRALGPISNSIHVLYHFDSFAPRAISVLQVEISWAIIISRNFVDQRTLSTNRKTRVTWIFLPSYRFISFATKPTTTFFVV